MRNVVTEEMPEVTEEPVMKVLKNLKRNKASRQDDITTDFDMVIEGKINNDLNE